MKAEDIAKLPTPETDSVEFNPSETFSSEFEVNICALSKSLEQRLAAAVMALESTLLLFGEDNVLVKVERETLAAIKERK